MGAQYHTRITKEHIFFCYLFIYLFLLIEEYFLEVCVQSQSKMIDGFFLQDLTKCAFSGRFPQEKNNNNNN